MGFLFSQSGYPRLAQNGLPLFSEDSLVVFVQPPVTGNFSYPVAGNTCAVTINNVTAGNTLVAMTTAYLTTPATGGAPTVSAADSVGGALADQLQKHGPGNGNGIINQWAVVDFAVLENAAAGSHTITVTASTNPATNNAAGYVTVLEVAGLVSVTPLDTSASGGGLTGTPTTGATAAPIAASDLALGAFAFITASTQTIAEPSSGGGTFYANLFQQASGSGGAGQLVIASVDALTTVPGAQNLNWGTFSGANWAAGIVLLKAAVAAPPLTLNAATAAFALTVSASNIYQTGDFILYAAPVSFDLTLAPSQDAFQLDAGMVPFSVTVSDAGMIIAGGTVSVVPFEWSDGLDIYDFQNGSLLVAWGPFGGTTAPPDSYNIYVTPAGGAATKIANVTGQQTVVSGLQHASYNAATGIITPSITYNIKVVPVLAGAELGMEIDRNVTPQPTSTMLVTPMKRLFPFPNTGLN